MHGRSDNFNILAFGIQKPRMLKLKYFLLLAITWLAMSCGTYRKNIMLQTDNASSTLDSNTLNYRIEPNDILELNVYTNDGERILDPDFELTKDLGANQSNRKPEISYIVNADGSVKLPLLGMVNLDGKTLREAELYLQEEYSQYYTAPYVNLQFSNKRVTVIGAVNKVVPLMNENVRLIEVLALADAIDNNARVQNIRLVRGGETTVLDLSIAKDIEKTNLVMQPGDVIYIEPLRRPFIEAVKDYGPIISFVSSITAIVVIISNSGGK